MNDAGQLPDEARTIWAAVQEYVAAHRKYQAAAMEWRFGWDKKYLGVAEEDRPLMDRMAWEKTKEMDRACEEALAYMMQTIQAYAYRDNPTPS